MTTPGPVMICSIFAMLLFASTPRCPAPPIVGESPKPRTPIKKGTPPQARGDPAAIWREDCASCHGKDGSGDTAMGRKLNVKDYREAGVQVVFSDAELERAIREGVKTNGKETMKPFGSRLSNEDIKSLVAYIRTLKK